MRGLVWFRDAFNLVRSALVRDVARIVELCTLHAQFERTTINLADKHSLLTEALFVSSGCEVEPKLYCWVAEVNKTVVGYATATIDFSTWQCASYLHLDCIYIEQKFRGHGLGQQLMHSVYQFARIRQIKQVQWQTPNWNVDASNFYHQLGAIGFEKRRFVWRVE
jgi:GNAT superfamily N-acetyltransferase